MNTTISFAALTLPTPEPYDSKHPYKQHENFYYALNQILTTLKSNNATLDLEQTIQATLNADLSELTQAVQDLSFAGESFDLPGLNIKRTGKVITIEYTP